MGQSDSELMKQQYINPQEWTNYMEWTNYKNLKKGEKYRIIIESYEFEVIFCYYSLNGKCDYCENCATIFKDNKSYYTSDDSFEYYKIISKKNTMKK